MEKKLRLLSFPRSSPRISMLTASESRSEVSWPDSPIPPVTPMSSISANGSPGAQVMTSR